MDKRELRERMGLNHHFHPEKNPCSSKLQHWWNTPKASQPLQIVRHRSSTLEDSSSSPIGSPASSSPHTPSSPVGSPAALTKHLHLHFNFEKQRARSYSADDHKDSVLT
ncbi:uncharacterized protein LOC128555772 [Mercenaria mercenaria]|uniref:uncharacterized protein LOC128555772 n=1 Tax=Mercenaria mercenaria TaxID=6596 RepID=UPI00234F1812|nr:uncharacterized protein LOC128555772 [Mercenaria mercenaria]